MSDDNEYSIVTVPYYDNVGPIDWELPSREALDRIFERYKKQWDEQIKAKGKQMISEEKKMTREAKSWTNEEKQI
jgi:hypothetical protein